MSRFQFDEIERRVLRVDVSALRAGVDGAARIESFAASDERSGRLAAAGGGALGLAWMLESAHAAPARRALLVSVGECVKRGRPTAARASVAARSPLTGLFAEGLVGGEFARRLASVVDLLVVESSAAAPVEPMGEVLLVEADGSARIVRDSKWRALSPHALHMELAERFGDCAALAVGPAALRGVRWANLAASGARPHFVGRGGLGEVLGATGLSAVCVRAPSVSNSSEPALTRALNASTRLAARAAGGTFEQLEALAASGELRERDFADTLERSHVVALADGIERARTSSHGCQGCPTPCGWVFRTDSGESQSARFGASYALGLNLGLPEFGDALALLARCDELGLDAKEAGAGLALLAHAAERGLASDAPRFGDRAGFERALEACVQGRGELAQAFARGPAHLARALGLGELHRAAKGASVRPDDNLAALLGQCVSSRGGDSMRTFPFQSFDAARMREWCARGGFELAPQAFDPLAPEGKGLLVAWHEDWSNALDALGFCSFSAAALLCDGVLELDELERVVAPHLVARDGAGALLRMGAEISLAQRDLNAAWGVGREDERPAWARDRLDRAGMLPQYEEVRRAQREGRWDWRRAVAGVAPSAAASSAELRARGTVRLRCVGAAAAAIGRESELELELPCTAGDLIAELAQRFPAAAPALAARGRPIASVFRAGRVLDPDALVRAGDVLDLVAVVSGG